MWLRWLPAECPLPPERPLPSDLPVMMMQMAVVINSYALPKLTTLYHNGSRQWMYDKVCAWLDAATLKAKDCGDGMAAAQSRLFLVLADAGMGKSVFSAVMSTKLQVWQVALEACLARCAGILHTICLPAACVHAYCGYRILRC